MLIAHCSKIGTKSDTYKNTNCYIWHVQCGPVSFLDHIHLNHFTKTKYPSLFTKVMYMPHGLFTGSTLEMFKPQNFNI